jgi:hypothetical protein
MPSIPSRAMGTRNPGHFISSTMPAFSVSGIDIVALGLPHSGSGILTSDIEDGGHRDVRWGDEWAPTDPLLKDRSIQAWTTSQADVRFEAILRQTK